MPPNLVQSTDKKETTWSAPRNSSSTHPDLPLVVCDAEVQRYLEKETGRDRLKAFFEKNEKGNLHEDLETLMDITKNATFTTFIFASLFGGRAARAEFVDKNITTQWKSPFRSSRAMVDAVFIGGIKTGAKFAIRVGAFTAFMVGSSQLISTYRNKSSPLDYAAGGVVAGGVLRLNLGLRGFISGGIFGAVIGLVGGTVIYGCLYATKNTQEQRHYWTVFNKLQFSKYIEAMVQGKANENSKDR